MLNERERKELERIEKEICAEDSRIGRRFADGFAGKAQLWPYTIAIVISVMILVAGIALVLPATILIATMLTIGALVARQQARARHLDRAGDDRPDT